VEFPLAGTLASGDLTHALPRGDVACLPCRRLLARRDVDLSAFGDLDDPPGDRHRGFGGEGAIQHVTRLQTGVVRERVHLAVVDVPQHRGCVVGVRDEEYALLRVGVGGHGGRR